MSIFNFAHEFRRKVTDLFKSTPVSNDPIGNTQPNVDYSSELRSYDAMSAPGNVQTYAPNDMQTPLPPAHSQEIPPEPVIQAEVPHVEYEPIDQTLFDEMMGMAIEEVMPEDPDPFDEIVQHHPMDEMDPIDEFEKDLERLIDPFGGM